MNNIVILGIFALIRWSSATFYPIIMVPGDGGSQMEAKLNKPEVVHYLCDKKTTDYFSLWLNMELLVPVIIDCLVDNMRLVYDNVTRSTSNAPGVDIRISGFGNSSVVEWLDPGRMRVGGYYKDIGNALVSLGYVRDRTLRGAPYDFRKAPNENEEYFTKLRDLVVETYNNNNATRVILLGHSMGALMCLEMLHRQTQQWKDKYIRTLITLSAPWGGSMKALKVYAMGDDLGVYILRGSVLRALQITSPSLAWLLPSPYFWKPNEVLVKTDDRNYTFQNISEFFDDIDYQIGWEMRKDILKYGLNFNAPGVEVHCLHGYNVPTVEQLNYASGKFPLGTPQLVLGYGDGTVNKRSLEGCLRWQSQQNHKIYHQIFENVDHMQILRDAQTVTYISQLVNQL